MIFQEDIGGFVTIKCDKCGTNHKKHKVYYTQYGYEYHFNPPITCNCGNTQRVVYKNKINKRPQPKNQAEPITCPSCSSTQLVAGHKGFGVGNAAVGAILFGPVGLLNGLIGSSQIMVTCLNCGRQWKAGHR